MGTNGPNLNPVAGQVLTYNGPTEAQSWEDITVTQSAFNASMVVWLASLPTTLPATAGQPWNNQGVFSIS
jgi:hypothetical protein